MGQESWAPRTFSRGADGRGIGTARRLSENSNLTSQGEVPVHGHNWDLGALQLLHWWMVGHGPAILTDIRRSDHKRELVSVYVLSMASTGDHPAAVLLDAGGVFVLPDPDRILGAFARAECTVRREVLADAHYRAAVRFGTHVDVEADWSEAWLDYLQTYVAECGVPKDWREEAHRHIDSEFADAALWVEPVPTSREGLQALADTGVRLGIVSNADGLMAQRLAQLELCQVGPGVGVEVECVVDSGNVGVMKPDPRIFEAAVDLLGLQVEQVWYVGDMPAIDVVGARRAGIRPFLMDPLGLHLDASYERVPSLAALADLITSSSSRRPPK
jgi:FMN phosphatase YigB (HAD superfamily)